MRLKLTLAVLITLVSNVALAGSTLLSVTGPSITTGETITHEFDRAELEQLTQHIIRTSTPWFEGISEFEGPSFIDVVNVAGIKATEVRVSALNDYASTIPVAEINKYGVILAMKRDGATLRVRDKGPLFVIYPFDQYPELVSEAIYGRSVWQVKAIDVVN